MIKYKILATVYLISVASSPIANLMGIDVQTLYRIPFLSIRWIDVSILIVIAGFIYNLTTTKNRLPKTGFIVSLCCLYLIFEIFQLYRSWGLIDTASQVSHFLSTLSLIIIIDLCIYSLSADKIVSFLKQYAIGGAVVIALSNLYLLYSFVSGNVIFHDVDNLRVAIEVEGSKETVYSTVLTPLIYGFGLNIVQKPSKAWKKLLFTCVILSIYVSLVITFHRGTFMMILAVTLYFLMSSGKGSEIFAKTFGTAFLVLLCYLIFGPLLSERGYDPFDKIIEVAEFTVDIDNPQWDKGRSISHELALDAWKKNLWIGAGYDDFSHYGFPENVASAHNGILTSLFHRGIIGTLLIIGAYILLFRNALALWPLLSNEGKYKAERMKLLVIVSFLWIITFMTQEAIWEKYSLCIQYLYLGLITNVYVQKKLELFS